MRDVPSDLASLEQKMSAAEVARHTVDCLGRTRRNVVLTWAGKAGFWLSRWAPWLLDRVGEKSYRRQLGED